MIKKLLQKNKGFTLVETLVAISILMISIAGPMVLVGNGIRSSAFARDQVTAFYLAQDAIEAVRYIRDGNRIAIVEHTGSLATRPAWDDLLQYGCDISPCSVDSDTVYNGGSGITPTGFDDTMTIDTEGKYGYDANGEPTKFKRSITIESINADEVQIVVTVDWSSGIFTRTFSIRENLFYWY